MLLSAFLMAATAAMACTNFIVGKKASADGSVICSYNADDYGLFIGLCHYPAGKHAKGEMRDIIDWDTHKYIGQIPEAPETYNVIGNINEYQVTIGETTIPAGRKTLLLYGSGNRDERQYGPDAGELDVTRAPRNILTFSHGAHHCLGAAAARMQSRVALTELLSRIPEFTVDEDNIEWAGGSYVRRPLSVPFTGSSHLTV